jgi:hypothetical protein
MLALLGPILPPHALHFAFSAIARHWAANCVLGFVVVPFVVAALVAASATKVEALISTHADPPVVGGP